MLPNVVIEPRTLYLHQDSFKNPFLTVNHPFSAGPFRGHKALAHTFLLFMRQARYIFLKHFSFYACTLCPHVIKAGSKAHKPSTSTPIVMAEKSKLLGRCDLQAFSLELAPSRQQRLPEILAQYAWGSCKV